MLERFNLFLLALGSFKAAAEYLGYTDRQLYNIRRSLEQGKSLHRRVEEHLSRTIDQFNASREKNGKENQ